MFKLKNILKCVLVSAIALTLSSCGAKSRTEVINTLVDAGFIKTDNNYYSRNYGDSVVHIFYYTYDKNYSKSGYNYFSEGPVVAYDKGNFVFYYHLNEDLMYYPYACKLEDGTTATTEIDYMFADNTLLLTHDNCSFDMDTVEQFYVEAYNYKMLSLETIETLGLSVEDLNNLVLE